MTKVFGAGLCLLFVFSMGLAYAEEEFVVSKQLTINDVKKTVLNHIKAIPEDFSLKDLHGIHQRDNSAEVYWSVACNTCKDRKVEQASTSLVRFNSGRWFNVDIGEFVRK